jgi:hypothetical protein
LAELAYGVDLDEIGLRLSMGQEVDDDFKLVKSATACEVWEEKSGMIRNIKLPKTKYIKESSIKFGSGEKYAAPPLGNKPLASFFVQCDDNSLKVAKKIRKNVKIEWGK